MLRACGALRSGLVTAVTATPLDGNWSRNAFLELAYGAGASGERPARLFLKTAGGFGAAEVHYYTRDYVAAPDAPLPRCYHAAHHPADDRYHLLLEDLSGSHAAVLERTPDRAYAEALAEACAALHAPLWGEAALAAHGLSLPTAADIDRFADTARPGIAQLRAHYEDALGTALLDTVERFFDTHPERLKARLQDPRGMCQIHGDINPTNVLIPRAGGYRPLYVIDRQPFDWSLTVFPGLYDLCHAVVHRWAPEPRRHLQAALLERYFHTLRSSGVTDYSWERLTADFRLFAGMGIYDATERNANGPDHDMRWLWEPMLRYAAVALADTEQMPR